MTVGCYAGRELCSFWHRIRLEAMEEVVGQIPLFTVQTGEIYTYYVNSYSMRMNGGDSRPRGKRNMTVRPFQTGPARLVHRGHAFKARHFSDFQHAKGVC